MRQFTFNKFLFPLIIALALPLTIFLVYQNTDSRQRASEGTILSLTADQPSVVAGQMITYTVAIDSQTTPVKSVQINLSYPANKVDIVSIETATSKFNLPLEEIKGNGLLRLGREASTPVFGPQHIAILQFQAKESITETEIAPVPGTQIISLENTNTYLNALSRLPQNTEDATSDQSFLSTLFNAVRGIFQ